MFLVRAIASWRGLNTGPVRRYVTSFDIWCAGGVACDKQLWCEKEDQKPPARGPATDDQHMGSNYMPLACAGLRRHSEGQVFLQLKSFRDMELRSQKRKTIFLPVMVPGDRKIGSRR